MFHSWLDTLLEASILAILIIEFLYDAEKDMKKQRKTRTVKKTSTLPTGETVTEESTESEEGKVK